ncbi:hypothetical protein [Silvimonas iriomotensis]|uniref:SmpA / OmlA family protein n=1 Tax=Silvimonas iriomotensis TaxID=449662 RepID=A0ABQ2P5V1_9NEIS|nr:hypothetical protein [Silvimonas iriomotensis]GGP18798.1 hypothetical protein GCM10010970_07330 [Silvimonas iriomotensis]
MRHLALCGLLTLAIMAGCAMPGNDTSALKVASAVASAPAPVATPTPTPAPTPVPVVKPRHKTRPPASAVSAVTGKPAPGSKFARLRIGMSRKQVEALIGLPGDVKTTQVGAYTHDETFYQHEGSLLFVKNGAVLSHITVDTSASGYQ